MSGFITEIYDSAMFAAIWAAIKAIWAFFVTVWNLFTKVWDTFRIVWTKIKNVWTYIKPLALDIYKKFIKPVIGFVEAINDRIGKVVKWFDRLYKNTIGRVENVYNLLFGRYEVFFKDYTVFKDVALRAIAKVDKRFAERLSKELIRIEAQTFGKIRGLRDQITGEINKVYHTVRDEMNAIYHDFKDLVDPWIAKAKKVEEHLAISFEAPDRLGERTTMETTRKYGDAAFNELIKPVGPLADDEAFDRLSEEKDIAWMDTALDDMEKWDKGRWSDLASFIDEGVDEVDKSIMPATKLMNLDLLSSMEKRDMSMIIDMEISQKKSAWLPRWMVVGFERLGVISKEMLLKWLEFEEEMSKTKYMR